MSTNRGVASVFNPEYARKRTLELHLENVVVDSSDGANVSEWERLARMFPGTVRRGGDRMVDA